MSYGEADVAIKDGDGWKGSDGCYYNHEWQVYWFSLLRMCGCGYPTETYDFLLEVLKLCDRREHHRLTGEINEKIGYTSLLDPTYKEKGYPTWFSVVTIVTKMIEDRPRLVAEMLLHMLDGAELLDHGTSISGSWTTDRGNAMIDAGPAKTD